ncbi:MAG: squalene/phytoene synthase family protein [Bacteroidetes bacterium]|nr:squalene/phytoene synthase family protein [Bacteroidota bacterium]
MFELFEKTAADCSKNVTQTYSTSFSLGIRTLHSRFYAPIYGIYGMVRYADEIVDTFHNYDKKYLLEKFKRDTYEAIESGISLNPILFSFQKVVNEFGIPMDLIESFFISMETDLFKVSYDKVDYQEYIYGSAEVVGLMCLKVFAEGDDELYHRLIQPAKALGAAFQKVNFLRDMNSDAKDRGRVYFPGIDFDNFEDIAKKQIEREVANDFHAAYNGILNLPAGAREGVLLAYNYYQALFHKIQGVSVEQLKKSRIRVPDFRKLLILFRSVAGRPFRYNLLGS